MTDTAVAAMVSTLAGAEVGGNSVEPTPLVAADLKTASAVGALAM